MLVSLILALSLAPGMQSLGRSLSRPPPIFCRVDQHQEAENEEECILAEEALAKSLYRRTPDFLERQRKRAQEQVASLEQLDLEPIPDQKPSQALRKALKKPKGTMAIIGEGAPQRQVSLGGYDLNDPKYISEQFRTAGAAAVCVRIGGGEDAFPSLSSDALSITAKEQQSAKGNFPGPLPVIVRGDIMHELQLIKAVKDGARGVLLSLILNGPEGTSRLMAEATRIGLEPIVRVADQDELSIALELNAKIICIGDASLEIAGELVAPLRETDVLTLCDVYSPDVRGSWKVRDLGFNAQIASDSILEVCARDRCPPESVLKAMLMKGSVKYGLGVQKGRLEGAKEWLGDLVM